MEQIGLEGRLVGNVNGGRPVCGPQRRPISPIIGPVSPQPSRRGNGASSTFPVITAAETAPARPSRDAQADRLGPAEPAAWRGPRGSPPTGASLKGPCSLPGKRAGMGGYECEWELSKRKLRQGMSQGHGLGGMVLACSIYQRADGLWGSLCSTAWT